MDFSNSSNRSTGSNKSFGTPSRKAQGTGFRDRVGLKARGNQSLPLQEGYPAALQLYNCPPTDDISLEQFEDWAVERLRLLRAIETQNMSGKTKFSQEWVDAICKELEKHGLEKYLELAERERVSGKKIPVEVQQENRRVDHISHFILKLAYCRTEELRRWFVTHETDLFRLRWTILRGTGTALSSSVDHVAEFMLHAGLKYQPISDQEKEETKENIQAASGMSGTKTTYEDVYRVPWLEAVDLVRARRVYVSKGFAYIPASEVLSLVVGVLRTGLSHSLVRTCRALPHLEEDHRLVGLVHNLDKRYTGEDYGNGKTGERVLPNQVEPLSKTHFPLCMRSMQAELNSAHHIKYKARLQYGLFLKGIGLTLEDALKFFRSEFAKRPDIDVDKFDKEYAYGIRYNYGKEGKKKNWQPWDCMRIIMESVGAGESHGCPFRHQEPRALRQRLEGQGLKEAQINQIVKKAEEGHYQVACSMQYSTVHHKELSTGVVQHPNQWYLESRGLNTNQGEQGGKKGTNIQTTKAVVYSNKPVKQNEAVFEEMDDSELLSAMETGM